MTDIVQDILAIAGNDNAAFTRLYRAERRSLLVHAAGLLAGDLDAAEDVVDAAFLAVWKSAGSFRGTSPAEVRAWLRGILRNKAVDWLRANGRYDLGWDGDDNATDPAASPEDAALAGDAAARLSAALANLSLDQREAVMLCYFEDLPLSQIAAIAQCPEGTVKTRLFHARKALRGMLGGENLPEQSLH